VQLRNSLRFVEMGSRLRASLAARASIAAGMKNQRATGANPEASWNDVYTILRR